MIAGILNFASLFQLPMVGADTCGFGGYPTEILCSRWAMLGAFSPFFRNHNANGVYSPQEFYVWPDTVAVAARKAIKARYQLMDYFYTALYKQSTVGTPSLNPLFFIYPEDTKTYELQYQYLYGDAILVSPVTKENATEVDIYLPKDIFYDFWTHQPVQGHGKTVKLTNVGITDIPVHIRGGTVIPMRVDGAMDTPALRKKDFELVVAPGTDGTAKGTLYLDDGDSVVQAATSLIDFTYANGHLSMSGQFDYVDAPKISKIVVLGTASQPKAVHVNGVQTSDSKVTHSSKADAVTIEVSLPLTKSATIQISK